MFFFILKAARCGYMMIIMGLYWMTEAVPLAVTSLIPIFAFPLMGLASTEDVCKNYFTSTIILYMAIFVIAAAVEYSNLHKRIALYIILKIGEFSFFTFCFSLLG